MLIAAVFIKMLVAAVTSIAVTVADLSFFSRLAPNKRGRDSREDARGITDQDNKDGPERRPLRYRDGMSTTLRAPTGAA
jgi:hypothetical protein